MRLTTKGRYAVAAMVDLANQGEAVLVPLTVIAERQALSISYLEQLFSKLKKQGMVESVRGATGGYRIIKPITSITIFDIVSAVDEQLDTTSCSGQSNCLSGGQCLTHDLWQGLNQHITDYLTKISLADLLANGTQAQVSDKKISSIML